MAAEVKYTLKMSIEADGQEAVKATVDLAEFAAESHAEQTMLLVQMFDGMIAAVEEVAQAEDVAEMQAPSVEGLPN